MLKGRTNVQLTSCDLFVCIEAETAVNTAAEYNAKRDNSLKKRLCEHEFYCIIHVEFL